MAAVGGPLEISEERLGRWYTTYVEPGRKSDVYCLIIAKAGKNPVGEVSFHQLDSSTMTAVLNIKIAHNFRGRGYARDALQTFLDFCFEQVGGSELLDDIALNNVSGHDVLQRYGFVHDSSREDVYLVRMTRQRFDELYKQGRKPKNQTP